MSSMFTSDENLRNMVVHFRRERSGFLQMFELGFKKYISGDWINASAIFFKIKKQQFDDKFQDQPTLTLLAFMDQYKFIAPDDWKGFRALTEK